jgi:hypothetical protein
MVVQFAFATFVSPRRAGCSRCATSERRRTVRLITAATTLTAILALALALLAPGDGQN